MNLGYGDRAAREALALNRVQSSMLPLPVHENERMREERAREELLTHCPVKIREMSSNFLRKMGAWSTASWSQKNKLCHFFARSETGEALLSVLDKPNVKINFHLQFFPKVNPQSGCLKFTVNDIETVLKIQDLDTVDNKDSMKNIYLIMEPTLYHQTLYSLYEYWNSQLIGLPPDERLPMTLHGILVYQTDNQSDFDDIVAKATGHMAGAGRAVRHAHGRRSRKSRKTHKKTKHVKRSRNKRYASI